MELKEYLKIFNNHRKSFIFIVFLSISIGLIFFLFRPISCSTSLTINLTRSGQQETNNYKYDDFYRLQADEKFVETIVEWLKSPRTVADIYTEAGLDFDKFSLKGLSKAIKAEKLSSQIVAVSFSTPNEEVAKKISRAINTVLSKNILELNINQKENAWFEIISHEPVVIQDDFNLFFIALVFFLIGIFFAFWIVLIIHYLE